MKCTHCKQEITGFRQSAEIPGRPNHYFIVHTCANVMIAEIVDGELVKVEATPEDNSESTKKMINLCYELMAKAGEGNYKQVKASETSERQNLPLAEEKKYETPDPEPCSCNCCGDSSCYKSKEYDSEQDKSGFFKKLWHKFLHLIGRN